LVCLGLIVLVGAGCKKKEPPPPPAKVEQKKMPAQAPATPPVQKQPSTAKPAAAKPLPVLNNSSTSRLLLATAPITLEFANRKDPFKPFMPQPVVKAPVGGKPGRKVQDLLPIQRFDTEKFKVSGIIAGVNENRALVIDPNGKGYVVKEGMQIGSNEGQIKRITANTVEVEERFADDSGKVRKRLVKLILIRKSKESQR
jgi:type IV pilus assembly protein PilP